MLFLFLKVILKRTCNLRKEEYANGDVILIDIVSVLLFLSLNDIPANSKVIIDAKVTVYFAHDTPDLFHEFKTTRATDKNIIAKLKEFKKEYQLDYTLKAQNHVTIKLYYYFAKKKKVKKEGEIEVFPNYKKDYDKGLKNCFFTLS